MCETEQQNRSFHKVKSSFENWNFVSAQREFNFINMAVQRTSPTLRNTFNVGGCVLEISGAVSYLTSADASA